MDSKQSDKEINDLVKSRTECLNRFHDACKEMERLAMENRSKGYHPFLGTGLSMEQITDMVRNGVKN